MDEIYLDNAATSFPKPESVYVAMTEFMRQIGTSPSRGSYQRAQEAERKLIMLRSRLSQLLGIANPSRLILTANATDSLNMALKGFLREGDHVIVTDVEHNAVLRPLWGLRQSRQIDVSIVTANNLGEIDPDEIFKLITPKTRLICCTHASNVLGTIQPIHDIARRCCQQQVFLLVDGSQTVGAIPVNIEQLGVDFYAFTGHKSLLGPTGTGGLFVREGIEMTPFREGGNGIHSEDLTQPVTWPERHESGTPNMVGLAGLLAGVDYLLERGVDTIQAHELHLNKMLMTGFQNIDGVTIYGPDADKKTGITSIGFQAMSTAEMGQILSKKFGIMIRTGIHCAPLIHNTLGTKGQGTLRFSMGFASTTNEIMTVIQAVQDIARAVYRRQSTTTINESESS
jgi:cysteine desulfurase family protein